MRVICVNVDRKKVKNEEIWIKDLALEVNIDVLLE